MLGFKGQGPLSAKLPGLTPRASQAVSPTPNAFILTAENVPLDFKPRNAAQRSGCACDPDNKVYFRDAPYNVKTNQEFLFRYDASQVWHGQGFNQFFGVANWGPLTTPLHDFQAWSYWGIAGTLKVTFFKAGDYNVIVNMYANCLDGFYHCSNTCTASGAASVHVHD
jgi:hypothetical protein